MPFTIATEKNHCLQDVAKQSSFKQISLGSESQGQNGKTCVGTRHDVWCWCECWDEDGSTDGIPDDFMGVVDTPAFDGSEPPLSQPDPQLDDKVGGQLRKQV